MTVLMSCQTEPKNNVSTNINLSHIVDSICFDSIIKDYKKKNDDINLEKEILNKKLQMKDNKINKINLDFNNI